MIKKYFDYLYKSSDLLNRSNVEKSLEMLEKKGVLLDVGCWNGEHTLRWASAVSAKQILGIETVPKAAALAGKKGIKVYIKDVNTGRWPIKNESVDYVVSTLVVEHLSNLDHFISESYRVLKKGGYTIVSTNNLSSWHNVVSIILGWSPFDISNSSEKQWSVGNPLALHVKEDLPLGKSYTHKCIYNPRWLKEWYELYGFKQTRVLGAGYYPLPPFLGNIDKVHCAFITLTFKK
ncbi:MAG: hypothetical protein US96_C0006G0024 [Candidatus Woesebacteria bacterium GW2011_GWB1_38_5b]|uniref:Methyltransferase type 11 domain-containing protein n=1 Tax=Candidatus Woesebacteria bacterium GW2011_GWB1_38_5b TaxID=1618569 RepID=A0A0G0KA64_9BACT|nr:MAG: hypothetical protein US96_C0006G0024 [Candidatus Woesebacteria bacterium GW2011_GWB1_38_5b]